MDIIVKLSTPKIFFIIFTTPFWRHFKDLSEKAFFLLNFFVKKFQFFGLKNLSVTNFHQKIFFVF